MILFADENPSFFTRAEMFAFPRSFAGAGVTTISLYDVVRFGNVELFTVSGIDALLFVSDISLNVLKGSAWTVRGRSTPVLFAFHVISFVIVAPAGIFTVSVTMSKGAPAISR